MDSIARSWIYSGLRLSYRHTTARLTDRNETMEKWAGRFSIILSVSPSGHCNSPRSVCANCLTARSTKAATDGESNAMVEIRQRDRAETTLSLSQPT